MNSHVSGGGVSRMHHSLADSPYAVTPLVTPLLTPASAARILDLSERPRTRRASSAVFLTILLLTAHIASSGGSPSLAQAAAMSAARASTQAGESPKMKRLMAIGAAAAVSMTSGTMAQSAVEWRVADGGNGHWYAGVIVRSTGASWTEARAHAQAMGGDLASLLSAPADQFVFERVVNNPALWSGVCGPWVGGWQQAGSAEPSGGWQWVNGDPIAESLWSPDQPDDATYCGGDNNRMGYWNSYQGAPRKYLEDSPDSAVLQCGSSQIGLRVSAVVEWSADCNNDGIVDYGQILVGDLTDANHNNIPDCCESNTSCACAGDTNADDQIDGIDLATILARWAQPAAKFPNADCNSDGLIDGIDLAIVLGSWGPCP